MKVLKWVLCLLILAGGVAMAQDDDEDDGATTIQYVGAAKCGKCHKTAKQGKQLKIWEGSEHAKAFETLKSPEAAKIAKEKGLSKPAHEAPECLKCHVSGYKEDASMKAASFDMALGVQCETCHGPGSLYKKKKIMKDRAAAIAQGMADISVEGGSAEKQCVTCHNDESPTFKSFNFAEMWEKIAHPVPE